MTTMYRFVCYEEANPTYPACLIGMHKQTGAAAYFDSLDVDLTFDITSMATTPFITDEQPLMGLSLRSQPSRTTIYVPLNELADAVACNQDDTLWRLLRMATRNLPAKYRLA